jgi:hypothetical protein
MFTLATFQWSMTYRLADIGRSTGAPSVSNPPR